MKKLIVTAALVCAAAMVGCVSVEATRAQLSSSDPNEVQKAKQNILKIATKGRDPLGLVKIPESERIEYVNLVTDNAMLLKIIKETYGDSIVSAAASKIDLTKKGVGLEILTQHKDTMDKVDRAIQDIDEEKARNSISGWGQNAKRTPRFSDKVIATLSPKELLQQISSMQSGDLREKLSLRLIEVTKNVRVLALFFNGKFRDYMGIGNRGMLIEKLAESADKKTDAKLILELLEDENLRYSKLRPKVLTCLPGQDAENYAFKQLEGLNEYNWDWKERRLTDLVAVIGQLQDTTSVTNVLTKFLAKANSCQEKLEHSWSGGKWTKEDDDEMRKLIGRLPNLDDATIEALVGANGSNWRYFIDKISVEMAYGILSGGKAKSAAFEAALVKKLPTDKVDMKVYEGVRFEESRKVVSDVMSPEMKASAAEASKKAVQEILAKAKDAAKETFELEGFSLGMNISEVYRLVGHYFPDWKVSNGFHDEEKTIRVLFVPNQSLAFCRADKDGKVFEFNFGKAFLKKFYKFDVQNYSEWANAYSKVSGFDLRFTQIDRNFTISNAANNFIGGGGGISEYHTRYVQTSYTYKHNAREFRVTYYGDYSVFGGDRFVKTMTWERARYGVGGEPGSLRVKVDND